MIASSSSGIDGSVSRGRGTCAFLIALSACLPFKLPKSERAQVSSHSTIPVAKMSLRGSTGAPAACSGDMYANLPLTTPSSSCTWRARAMPKSTSFTIPSHETRMFCGETSRWTMPSASPYSSVLRCA